MSFADGYPYLLVNQASLDTESGIAQTGDGAAFQAQFGGQWRTAL
jgi:uncharacterized protein YcbX